jgi:hypothetical protein
MIAAGKKIQSQELIGRGLAHGLLHRRVVRDGIQRRNVRVGQAVPKDQLATR